MVPSKHLPGLVVPLVRAGAASWSAGGAWAKIVVMGVDDVANELYGLAPTDFVAAREARAAEARARATGFNARAT